MTPGVYAQTPGTNPHLNFFQELVQFISQKFGLDKTQVQTAITDFKANRKVAITPRPTLTPDQLAKRDKSRLDELVKDGKITTNQESLIISEIAAIRSKYNLDTMKNLTPDERKTQMTARRDEIVTWAKSQGIDSSYIMGGGFGEGGRGMGMRDKGKGWGGWNGTISPTPIQ
jgi:hypothetical protein